MVRAYLGGHVDADLFGLPDQADRLLRADVADVVVNARRFRKQNIAPDMDRLRLVRDAFQAVPSGEFPLGDRGSFHQRVVLAVGDDRHSQRRRKFHRVLHHLRALHAYAVVGEADCAGFLQRGKVGQLAAKLAFRDRRVRQHIDEPRFVRFLFYVFYRVGIIGYRSRVRHAGDRGEAAFGRRAGARFDRFFMLKARFAQCTCMSIKPGVTSLPPASIIRVSARPLRPPRPR